MVVSVQATTVGLQFLSFYEGGGGCECTADSCCSFCHFVREVVGVVVNAQLTAVAVSVIL